MSDLDFRGGDGRPARDADRAGACGVTAYRLLVVFGRDGVGPFAVLPCGVGGCGGHEAVRPVWSEDEPDPREDALIGRLLDAAEADGWYLGGGAPPTCPVHGWGGAALAATQRRS